MQWMTIYKNEIEIIIRDIQHNTITQSIFQRRNVTMCFSCIWVYFVITWNDVVSICLILNQNLIRFVSGRHIFASANIPIMPNNSTHSMTTWYISIICRLHHWRVMSKIISLMRAQFESNSVQNRKRVILRTILTFIWKIAVRHFFFFFVFCSIDIEFQKFNSMLYSNGKIYYNMQQNTRIIWNSVFGFDDNGNFMKNE